MRPVSFSSNSVNLPTYSAIQSGLGFSYGLLLAVCLTSAFRSSAFLSWATVILGTASAKPSNIKPTVRKRLHIDVISFRQGAQGAASDTSNVPSGQAANKREGSSDSILLSTLSSCPLPAFDFAKIMSYLIIRQAILFGRMRHVSSRPPPRQSSTTRQAARTTRSASPRFSSERAGDSELSRPDQANCVSR